MGLGGRRARRRYRARLRECDAIVLRTDDVSGLLRKAVRRDLELVDDEDEHRICTKIEEASAYVGSKLDRVHRRIGYTDVR
jgi:hypothetical protein